MFLQANVHVIVAAFDLAGFFWLVGFIVINKPYLLGDNSNILGNYI